ncbi:MAG: PKD domain-containing protein [Candidatus Pacearchaeota archaeon]
MKVSLKESGWQIFLLLTLFLAFIFLIDFSKGAFIIGSENHSLQRFSTPNTNITGWINISLNNETINSTFYGIYYNILQNGRTGRKIKESNLTLREILRANSEYSYSCYPQSCKEYYSLGNEERTKIFSLTEGSTAAYGINITSRSGVSEITKFSMRVSSDAGASMLPQLAIVFLDGENTFKWKPYKPSGEFSPNPEYGCYNERGVVEWGILSENPYTNKIKIKPTPNLKIGAEIERVENTPGGGGNFSLEILNQDTDERGRCNVKIPSSNNIQQNTIECIPLTEDDKNFTVLEEGNFIISIYPDDESKNKFKIKYMSNESCYEEPVFKLFVKRGGYGPVGMFTINNTEIYGASEEFNIEERITNYINEEYGGNCSKGCIIPIKFYSNLNQQISISGISITYTDDRGISNLKEVIGLLKEHQPKISSDYGRLFFEGFAAPESIGNFSFELKFGGRTIFRDNIEVRNTSLIGSLTPITTAIFVPTEFVVQIEAPQRTNIQTYLWDFGDNTTQITQINRAIKTYEKVGTYKLRLTVTDNFGAVSSKTFEIRVNHPMEFINQTILNNFQKINRIMNETRSFSLFQQQAINHSLNLTNISLELESIRQRYNIVIGITNEEEKMNEMREIVSQLSVLEVPERILITKKTDPPIELIPEPSIINLEIVKTAAGGNYSIRKTEAYRRAIVKWQIDNLDTKIKLNEFSVGYNAKTEPLVTVLELEKSEKRAIPYNYYLIIPELNNLVFDNQLVRQHDNFYYINLKNVSRISFFTTEQLNPNQIPIFISPPLNRLEISAEEPLTTTPGSEKGVTQIIFLIIIASILILGLVIYIMMRRWYKTKYETHLFPNKGDLYNLIQYIKVSREKGMPDEEIINNLKKVGWKGEQIKYVMKKFKRL